MIKISIEMVSQFSLFILLSTVRRRRRRRQITNKYKINTQMKNGRLIFQDYN